MNIEKDNSCLNISDKNLSKKIIQNTLNNYKYCNEYFFSDIEPYEIINIISDKTIEVRAMTCTRNFQPEWVSGGFSAICTNDQNQDWIIESNPSNILVRLRRRKDGNFYSGQRKFRLNKEPIKYYDFNF